MDKIKARKEKAKLKTKMKILCNKNKKRNKLENKDPEIENVKKKTAIQSGDGKLVFSKFDFTESEGTKPKKKGKDLEHLLSKALKNKEKVKKLEADDLEHATVVKDKSAWMSSLKRADGEKVFDDLSLIQKAVKKKKTKIDSQTKWKMREGKLKQKMDQAEQKRKANIEKVRKKKFEAKKKKLNKRGRTITYKPGF